MSDIQSASTPQTNASQWLEWLDDLSASPLLPAFVAIYGSDQTLLRERAALLRDAVETFIKRCGDLPIRVFRAPARINLRGMHVDTHGGYLNLMTHQRETVIAAAEAEPGHISVYNTDSSFEPVELDLDGGRSFPGLGESWMGFINSPEFERDRTCRPGHWAHYISGCYFSLRHRFPHDPPPGVRAAIAADIPHGAALSSSASLCTVLLLALQRIAGYSLPAHELILAEQDAEWYTGARTGTSDQAAIILGERDAMLNAALRPGELSDCPVSPVPFPPALRVVVINSYTRRSLSGSHRMAYIRNRFAYSLALDVLRQEMSRAGLPRDFVNGMRYLSDITGPAFGPHGGQAALWRLLRTVPERIELDELKRRYTLPHADEQYAAYFDGFPDEQRPTTINLRGPLIFGVAESERARLFPHLIAGEHYEEAGRMMSRGHDGDRVVDSKGEPCAFPVDDATLGRYMDEDVPIEQCPGSYGASSPALDALVDHALASGALGACLTGAGIAGSVLALCRTERADDFVQQMRTFVASPAFAERAHLATQPRPEDKSAVTNQAVASACEIRPDQGNN